MRYPKIKRVSPLKDMQLFIFFEDGSQRIYDCSLLVHKAPFDRLQSEWFFNMVQVDQGGYGVVWNDELDLAESELWLNGVDANQVLPQTRLDVKADKLP